MVAVTGLIALIDALAWPLAMLAVSLLFRHEVRGILARLGQFKYAGLEMTFRDELRDAETLARAIPRPEVHLDTAPAARVLLEVGTDAANELVGTLVSPEGPTSTSVVVASPTRDESRSAGRTAPVHRIWGNSPRRGVIETWGELQRGLLQAASHLGDRRAPAPVRVEGAVRFLVERGWISGVEGQLVERLRTLAEQVEAHDGPPVSRDEARRFVDLAVPLIGRIAELGGGG